MTNRTVTIRDAEARDAEKFIPWVWDARAENMFDPDVLEYPTTNVLAAEDDDGGQILFLPIHNAIICESLAINPETNVGMIALGLREMDKKVVDIATAHRVREIYFLTRKDSGMQKLAESHGYEEVMNTVVMRKKLGVVKQ